MAVAPTRRRARPSPYRFSLAQFLRMAEGGLFGPDERVELVLGRVYRMRPPKPPHIVAATQLRDLLRVAVPRGRWSVFGGDIPLEIPAPLRRDGLPFPDAFIARGGVRDYASRRPKHADVALVAEVSDTTLALDRGGKLIQYALAGLPVYSIVNLVDRRVEVYADPTGPDPSPRYRQRAEFGAGQSVPLRLPDEPAAEIAVDDLLPPA